MNLEYPKCLHFDNFYTYIHISICISLALSLSLSLNIAVDFHVCLFHEILCILFIFSDPVLKKLKEEKDSVEAQVCIKILHIIYRI